MTRTDELLDEARRLPRPEYTYAHSGSLTYGDPYFFVPAEQWGSVYRAVLGDMIEPSELKTEFGEVAAERARPDRKAITLRLTRQNEELG